MPMPIELPLIDWPAVYESGKTFEDWMASGENQTNLEAIRMMLEEQTFPPDIAARIKAVKRPVHVVAIAEDWCPDVVRHVPVLQKMSELNPKIQVRYITRTQWLDVFMRFLTVGGEAVPKFIFLNDKFVETGDWGPMPRDCREFIARGKAYGDNGKARMQVFKAYGDDPDRQVPAREIFREIDIAASEPPF